MFSLTALRDHPALNQPENLQAFHSLCFFCFFSSVLQTPNDASQPRAGLVDLTLHALLDGLSTCQGGEKKKNQTQAMDQKRPNKTITLSKNRVFGRSSVFRPYQVGVSFTKASFHNWLSTEFSTAPCRLNSAKSTWFPLMAVLMVFSSLCRAL